MKINKCFFLLSMILINSCHIKDSKNLAEVISQKKIDTVFLLTSEGKQHFINQDKFINNLKETVKIDGIWKFKKSKIVILYSDKLTDTIYTDGTIFSYNNNYYKKVEKEDIAPDRADLQSVPSKLSK